MSSTTYITTTIPYVNAEPHVGFALELVQADALNRYHRLLGHHTRFQTGTDENALKNVLAAEAAGVSAAELVDRHSRAFRELCAALNIQPDRFVRTTEPAHRAGAEWFWQRLSRDDTYEHDYEGLYCTGCEDFFQEKDLVEGRCPIHQREPVAVSEKNLFFRLSAYQEQIENLLETGRLRVLPESRRNEILSFVRSGLRDFSITRSAERARGWGIPVPGDDSQVIYVWLDALTNYLSGLGCHTGDDTAAFWTEESAKIHILGRDVWKFHAVYWPAFLLSAGLPLPDTILIHGFLTVNGKKISKSSGQAIDPFATIRHFGSDAVRAYLLRAIAPFDDGDFSSERLSRLYHSDLANGLGNLVSRLTRLCESSDYGRCDHPAAPPAPDGYHEAFAAYRYDKALGALWDRIGSINRDIETCKPWVWLKAGDIDRLHPKCTEWLIELFTIAHWIQPFLPNTGQTITQALSEGSIKAQAPLFPRLKVTA